MGRYILCRFLYRVPGKRGTPYPARLGQGLASLPAPRTVSKERSEEVAKKKRECKRKMWLYALGQFLLVLFYYPVFRMRVRGRENIPRTGPLLVCCNHAAKRDPVMLGVSMRRQVFYMAKEELFRGRFLGGLLRKLGAFPVLRGSGGADALQEAYDLLDDNAVVGVFIEGTRSKTGELGRPKTGAALLAYRTKAPVVPVCITAEDGRPPRVFKRTTVKFGRPIPFEALEMPDDSSMQLRKASRKIMSEIAALRAESLREFGIQPEGAGEGEN